MRMQRWWIPVAMTAVVAVAVACSGGGSKNKTPASATAATSSSGGKSGNANVPDVKAITQKFANATFHATYNVTGGSVEGSGEMVIYKDGPNRFRYDVSATQNGQPMSLSVIQKDNTSALCLKDAGDLGPALGIGAGKGVCFKSDPNDPNNPVGNLSSTFSDIENADVTVLDTSTRQVAGRSASCYRVKDNTSGNVSTICFGSDGTMLYVQTEGTDANTIEATDVKSSVSGSDFDLPYEVRDFPGASSTP